MNKKTIDKGARTSKPVLRLAAATPIKQFAAPLDAKSMAYVSDLSKLLSLARRGKLSGFIWAGARTEDDDQRSLIYSALTAETEDPISALGLLEVMKRELLQEVR